MMIIMGNNVFDSLPDNLKRIVQETATEVAKIQRDENRKDAEILIKKLEDVGVKVNHLNEKQLDAFAKVAEKLAPEFKKLVGAEVYDQVMGAAKAVR
jgi:TRAP-type C4-dicarboxylate transport system substrate-binding protein